MDYFNVRQTATLWGISDRRVRILCSKGKIIRAIRKGRAWMIPADAVKPADGRRLQGMAISKAYAPLFARIDALKEQLDRKRPLTEEIRQRLQKEFAAAFAYHSNAIEGNALTLQKMALTHRNAFSYIWDLVRQKELLSEKTVRTIHSLMLTNQPEEQGVYRRVPACVPGAAQPRFIPVEIEQLTARFIRSKHHPIESAALFHLRFKGIRPFNNGNGQTGRLILNFSLMQNGYPPIIVAIKNRHRYNSCFESFRQNGDAQPMVEMVALYVEEQLRYYLNHPTD